MFFWGFDVPLAEILFILGIVTIIILIEVIVVLTLLIYYKRLEGVKGTRAISRKKR